MPAYTYIQRQQQLDLAVSQLSNAQAIAVDLESSGYYTYYSDVCLIQLSTGGFHYIVDVLSNLNLDGLGAVFSNKKIIKIFHGAASDVTELRRSFKWEVNNVFDTLYACRMLAHNSCSLASLAKLYFDVDMEKKEQKSNWKKRPLTKAQLDYANLDTVYLEELMEKLVAEIRTPELLEELRQEAQSATRGSIQEKPFDPDGWVRINGSLDSTPIQRGYLRILYKFREKRARKDNIAAFRLITNDAMIRISRSMPTKFQDLKDMRLVNPVFLKKDGQALVNETQDFAEIPDEEIPREDVIDESVMSLFRELKRWRLKIAEFRGMDTSLILSNRYLKEIAEVKPKSLDELAELDILSELKMKMYGEQILSIVKGDYGVAIPQDLPRVASSKKT